MATSTCYFLVALVGGAVCNPLGQTTTCETQNCRNGLLQALGSTTICDATPNLIGRGYGHGLNLQGAPYLPSYVNGPFCPYGISPGYGSTTVCGSVPNVGPSLGVLGGLGGCSGLSTIIPGSTTVYESTPNLGLGIGGNGYGGIGGLGAVVPASNSLYACGSTPNFGPGCRYGVPYFPDRACQTNMCESITPNLGLEIECNRCGGIGGLGAVIPDSTTLCTCENTSNFVPGLCYGEPCIPDNAGQTTICECITPNQGLGIGCNGCGGTGGLGTIFPNSATVCTCDSTPNFVPGLCYGGPYFPNRAGQINIYETIPNVNPGYLYGIPRFNNFGPGLGHGYY